MSSKPRILIVEDDGAIAELIEINLRFNGFEPFLAGDSKEAMLHILGKTAPDLVLLDWMLPGTSGFDFVSEIRAHRKIKEIGIIMLTARALEAERVAALNAGADDYVSKPFSIRELVARINAVLRRKGVPEHAKKYQLGNVLLDVAAHQVYVGKSLVKLGPTEYKLIEYFLKNPNRAHSRGALLSNIWESGADIDERTIDVHIKRLREALGACGKMIETVRNVGYRMTAGEVISN